MNTSLDHFIGQSIVLQEFLDRSKPLVYNPDPERLRQQFDIPKRQLENVVELVKNGELDLDVADERRRVTEKCALAAIPKYIWSSWATSEGLALAHARYHSAVTGEAIQPDVEEVRCREEALREFEDALSEFLTLHQIAC